MRLDLEVWLGEWLPVGAAGALRRGLEALD